MNSLLQKIKLVFSKIKSTKVSYGRRNINPKNDWAILLMLVSIILCVLVVVSFYFYTQIDQGKAFNTVGEGTSKLIKVDATLLKKTVDDINFRESLNLQIESNKPNVADPSI